MKKEHLLGRSGKKQDALNWQTRARFFWMRLATSHWNFKRSCCASYKSRSSRDWGATARTKLTSAWLRLRIVILLRWGIKGHFARIFTTGSKYFLLMFRRYGSVVRT